MSRGGLGDATAETRASLLIVDDHPAVRAGLVALLGDERSLALLPPAAGSAEALTIARRRAPQIALIDVSLEDGDGLRLCLELKRLAAPPAVVLYTASADPLLAAKARLVGADGLIRKTARASELRQAIAAALQGEGGLPAFDHDRLRATTEPLSPDLLAVIGLRLNATPLAGIAEVLGVSENEVVDRISALLGALDARVRRPR